MDNTIRQRIAENFGNDRTKYLAHVRSQGLTETEYRKAVQEDIIYRYMRSQQRRVLERAKK